MPFTPEQWEGLQVEKDISEKDILEIGGLWTEKGLSGFRKLVLYAQMIIIAHEQARLQNKKYIMCGTHVKALRPFMHRVMRKIVYDGYCKLGDRDEWVTLFAARTEGLFLWASVQILQRFVFGWLRKLLGRSSDSSHHKNLTKLTPTARFSVRKMPRRGRSERATRR
ncbi:hypothetical protein [Spirosoma montaniterrae]|uniref:hypothetical protein n=1 Tax=Spirosoma montaniterrae TaxID=1178516 RepID=UPI0012F8580F|nr:hypothetical protein [Spirosoma montaniterrae]